MELFAIAQKHYYSFSKLARIWKIRKFGYYNNDVDLCLKPLDSFPESQKITLIHFEKKYVFRLTDLMNIWIRALTKNDGFSPSPRYPFNPVGWGYGSFRSISVPSSYCGSRRLRPVSFRTSSNAKRLITWVARSLLNWRVCSISRLPEDNCHPIGTSAVLQR